MLVDQYALVQTVAPTLEPVTVAEAKRWGWITSTADDAEVNELIPAVRERLEALCGLQLITASWAMYFDSFPCFFQIPIGPMLAVTSIVYDDTAGTSQTLSSSVYRVDIKSKPARVVLAYNHSWPATRSQINAVTLTFTAGYAATEAAAVVAVPKEIKKRICQGVVYRLDNRHESDEEWLDGFLNKNRTWILR